MEDVRVSKKTDPAKAASSILFMLQDGRDVEVTALGSASSVLIKSVALVATLNGGKLGISYMCREWST